MANEKWSSWSAITGANVDKAADYIPIIDASVADASKNKTILISQLRTAMFCGAKVKKSTDQTAANYSSGAALAWDTEEFDTDGWHDNVTNNSRLSVPSGLPITKVRLTVAVHGTSVTNSSNINIYLEKTGSGLVDFPVQTFQQGAQAGFFINGTHIDSCTAGTDYYRAILFCSDTSITVESEDSYFAIEAIG